jgi:hypothetical protein
MADLCPELRVVEYQNEWILKSPYPFHYESWATPQLGELRERYHLDEVIVGGQTEWEQLLLLLDWVHRRWSHGWSTASLDDALGILAGAEQGRDFSCEYYAATLTQCALSLGFQARRLDISKSDVSWIAAGEENVGHSVVEVWAQDWHKWVVLDADLNAYYQHRGVPLNGLEIHRLWKAGRWRQVRLVRGAAPFRTTDRPESGYGTVYSPGWIHDIFADFTRFNVTDYFSLLQWHMRNDYFSSSQPVPSLRWFDHTEPPQLVHWNRPIADDRWTCAEQDAYWTLNQAQISLRLAGDDLRSPVVNVEISHSMPNLDRLLVKLGEDEPWETYHEPFLRPIRPGKSVIEAKPISTFGREGYTSRIVLRYFRPQP